MSGTGTRFNQFLSNIQLNTDQISDAQTKYDGVCKKIHDHYYSPIYNGSTKLLIGSYGKNTAIAPPSDIDVIFKIPGAKFEKYDTMPGNGQSKLLQDVRYILLERYPTTIIKSDRNVVFVNFNSYAVEVVPAFELTNGNFYMPDSYGNGSWKTSSPKSEKDVIVLSNKKTNGNTVSLIKMLKAWRNNSNVPIKSILIELIAIEFLNQWVYSDKSSTYYDLMIREFYKYLLGCRNRSILMPGISELIDCGDKWVSKAESALNRSVTACKFESENKTLESSLEWRKIFGERYPL